MLIKKKSVSMRTVIFGWPMIDKHAISAAKSTSSEIYFLRQSQCCQALC